MLVKKQTLFPEYYVHGHPNHSRLDQICQTHLVWRAALFHINIFQMRPILYKK